MLDQPRKARLQHVARDAEVGLDLVKATQPQEDVRLTLFSMRF
jgi:hypothetical protein